MTGLVQLESDLQAVLALMEMHGVCIDTGLLQQMGAAVTSGIDRLESEVKRDYGSLKITSPLECRRQLFEKLKLDAGIFNLPRTSTGAKSTDEATLQKLIDKTGHRLPQLILEHRQLKKFINTTAVGSLRQCIVNGRVHSSFVQTGTATGRLSSEQPNMQNLPNSFVFERRTTSHIVGNEPAVDQITVNPRTAIKPASRGTPGVADSAGFKIVSADYSQIELRMLVHFSQEPELLKILNASSSSSSSSSTSGSRAGAEADAVDQEEAAAAAGGVEVDVFKEIASAWARGAGMKVAPSRDKCKRTVYAAIYGVGPETLATQLGRGTTVSQATVMLSSFGKRFPNIAKLRKAVVAQCRKHGFTETLLKRRRYFRKGTILSADFSKRMAAERQCFNHVLQGSAADVTKVAMIRVQERLHAKKLDARLLLQIHDELVLECATAEVAVCAGELAAAMQTAVSVSLPLPVVIKIGPSWGL